MSWDHVLWVARRATIAKGDATAHHVLLVIATHANKAGRAWPSFATIGREARLHPGSVRRAVQRLEIAGVVEVIHRDGQSCEFVFPNLPDPALSARHPSSFCAPPRAESATKGLEGSRRYFAAGSGWVNDFTGGDSGHWGWR
jgi:hypothetical protein